MMKISNLFSFINVIRRTFKLKQKIMKENEIKKKNNKERFKWETLISSL